MQERLYWVWGRHHKAGPAKAALERILGAERGTIDAFWRSNKQAPWANLPGDPDQPHPDDSVLRIPRQRASSTIRTSAVGGNDLREMVGKVVALSRQHGRAKYVCFEDHGFASAGSGNRDVVLFFGNDAVTEDTFARYHPTFARLREALAPGAEVFLFHCYATADGGRLALKISQALGVPVYGADAVQDVGDRKMQGNTLRAFRGQIVRNVPFPPAVLHYD